MKVGFSRAFPTYTRVLVCAIIIIRPCIFLAALRASLIKPQINNASSKSGVKTMQAEGCKSNMDE